MKVFGFFFFLIFLGTSSTFAAEIDTYYLQQFGELDSGARTSLKSTISAAPHKCGMPLKRELKSDWQKLESGTQKTLAKYTGPPQLENPNTITSSGGHFIIHHATSGTDAPPASYLSNGWINSVGEVFEYVYSQEISSMGYLAPPSPPYHVYLKNMSYFGLTDSDILTGQSATSYITIENDFVEDGFQASIPGNDSAYDKSIKALQITAAHEFHHAIQFGYNYYFQYWYAEASATWIEDEVYSTVNQLYSYSKPYLRYPSISLDTPVSLSTGGGYGRWIFNRLIAENHGSDIIKSIWIRFSQTTGPIIDDKIDDNHIYMMPIIDAELKSHGSSLNAELKSFAERLYKEDWISDITLIYSEPLTIHDYDFSTPSATSITLPHYSFAYYRFIPSPSVTDLQITMARTTGIQLALLKKTGSTFSEIPLNINGNSFTVSGFGSMDPLVDEVVLVIINDTSVDNHSANLSTDGTIAIPIEPPTTTQPPTTSESGGGGGGGCFIATAAYGSYLHPEVMALRSFRDRYLLTNLPGRVLVAAYYRTSPPLADFIGEHESARLIVRILLIPIIFAVKHGWLALSATLIIALTTFIRMRKTYIARHIPVN